MDSDTSPKTETLPKLPKEMLEEIFQRLPFRDLLKCREVNSTWKNAATNPLRKRCAPLNFNRKEILSRNQYSVDVESFIELIRATNEQGGFEEFPITKFHLELDENYYWIEVEGCALICHLLEAVSPFVKEIIFDFHEASHQLSNKSLAILHELIFPNLTQIALHVFEHIYEPCNSGVFSFVRNIIEQSPNVKEFHLEFNFFDEKRNEDRIRRWIVETGIQEKASLVTSLIIDPVEESHLEYVSKLGFKLKHFKVDLYPRYQDYALNADILKEFLESQSDTLTSLIVENGQSYHFRELPCLPHLKNLSIRCFYSFKKGQDLLPALFYKEQLPALKKLDIQYVEVGAYYFMASHLEPTESLRELIFPEEYRFIEAGGVFPQVARIFPNLKKLQIFHDSAKEYMSDIYEAMPGIEELCIYTDGNVTLDDITTGLPKRIMRKIRKESPPSYYWSKGLAMLDRGTTKSLACLENLTNLVIYRKIDADKNSEDVVGVVDFTDLSGAVLKQMKVLGRIDFGVRNYGPIVNAALQKDLEARGIKLSYQLPRYTPTRNDFIESLTQSDSSGSDSD